MRGKRCGGMKHGIGASISGENNGNKS